MGSKVDGLAVRDHFLPKNGLKTAILGDTILDWLTSEGAWTPILKNFALSICLNTTLVKWAIGYAAGVKIVRATIFYFTEGEHGNLPKRRFRLDSLLLNIFIGPRYTWRVIYGSECLWSYGDTYDQSHTYRSSKWNQGGKSGLVANKLAKLRRHASWIHFALIHFG